jgi:aryl-alcohol dehydrogenase-like predicted oxidoreductase
MRLIVVSICSMPLKCTQFRRALKRREEQRSTLALGLKKQDVATSMSWPQKPQDPTLSSIIYEADHVSPKDQLIEAVNGSLKRLQTEYIDLYQLHWPDRYTNFFGQRGYHHREQPETPIDETLRALEEVVKSGKVRTIGLSNETPWGTMKFLELAEREGLPRIESIQNPYSLLNRTYEIAMAEVSQREDVGLLAYSPLAMGLLTGKYRNGARPDGSRLVVFERFTRYESVETWDAAERYLQLADEHGLNPTHMALAFVNTRPFVLSNIIGATSMEQLKMNLDSLDVVLDKEVLKGIEAIQQALPNPSP